MSQRTPRDIDRIMEGHSSDPLDSQPLVDDGPMGPTCLEVLGAFFMLREAEASLSLTANIRMDRFIETVTLKLPSSKTSAAAASVDRS